MEWLSKSEMISVRLNEKEKHYSKIEIRKVSMNDDIDTLKQIALKVYFELTKIKSTGQIDWWVKNHCGINTTYVRDMTKLERVLFINIFITVPPCRGRED